MDRYMSTMKSDYSLLIRSPVMCSLSQTQTHKINQAALSQTDADVSIDSCHDGGSWKPQAAMTAVMNQHYVSMLNLFKSHDNKKEETKPVLRKSWVVLEFRKQSDICRKVLMLVFNPDNRSLYICCCCIEPSAFLPCLVWCLVSCKESSC